jgi:hypothetical protein
MKSSVLLLSGIMLLACPAAMTQTSDMMLGMTMDMQSATTPRAK